MREIYRNPMLYYALIPVLAVIWPVLVWGFYLPEAEKSWDKDQQSYGEATARILDILNKKPDILDVAMDTQSLGKFNYAEQVDRVANLCRIPSSNLDLSTGNIITTGGRETQQARVTLTNINIVQGARFLSTIQSSWVNLTCDRVKLTKKEGMPDQWDMDLNFKYDY